MPFRFDTQTVEDAKIKRTPSGGARVEGILTRPGVYDYQDSNGRTIKEYRPPEEVFSADSIASLDTAAVTERHPRTPVDSSNWQHLSIGFVVQPHEDKAANGVGAAVIVQQADAVRKLGTQLKETSCGYECRLDMTPGVTPEGLRYDCVQRDIRYNHVGLGPSGWGRQGPKSALRLDSAGDQEFFEPPAREENKKTMFKIHFDGKDFEGETSEAVQAKIDAHIAAKGSSTLQSELDASKGREAVLKQQLVDAQTSAQVAPVAVKARLVLEDQASKVLGAEFKCDGKPDREVRVAVIKRYQADFADTGKSDDYVAGVFDQWVNSPKASEARRDSLAAGLTLGAREVTTDGATTVKNDGLDREHPSADLARAKMNANLGKTPARAGAVQVNIH